MRQSKEHHSIFAIAIRRPVAISMFFLAIALLGIFSWFRIPVELVPAISGGKLFVNFYRPGSDPEVVEREILIPLESRIAQLPGVTTTSGEIDGSQGRLNIEFEPDSNYRVRELELRKIAAELTRNQPGGTRIRVSSQDTSAVSRFVMSMQVLAGNDSDALRDFVEERIQPQLESVEGVSQVFIFGGASREVTVELNPKRCAELGIKISQVTAQLRQSVDELRYLGSIEQEQHRISVVYDGRIESLASIGEIRIVPHLPVLLRDVADIKMSTAPRKTISRVNGQAAVVMAVFQDQGSNLVELGNKLRHKLDSINSQFKPYGIELINSFDASQKVEKQLKHLQNLALSGYVIALLILYLFLKEIRAVAVVAIAVPMSLLTAGAFLYLSGLSLNLITLFGLVIGVGMLVDNSIVVYESVQRNLEKGANAAPAVVTGIRRTIRAIITASATNAIVFLPLIYIQDIPIPIRQLLENIVPAILYPLAASLIVAIGLVPLLAHRLAAPAALARISINRQKRQLADSVTPSRLIRDLFSGLLKVALRRPAPWLISTFIMLVLTLVIALPWVLVQSITQPINQADQVRLEVEFDGGSSLSAAGLVFERLEQAALNLSGVESVESNFQAEQGSINVRLEPLEERPQNVTSAKIRSMMNAAIKDLNNVQLRSLSANTSRSDSSNATGLIGTAVSQIAISGPEMQQISRLAEQIKERLLAITQIENVTINQRKSLQELHVQTDFNSLLAHRLNSETALESLASIGREGQRMALGFNLSNGREVPIVIRQISDNNVSAKQKIDSLPVVTNQGVYYLKDLVKSTKNIPPLAIIHQNGQRELRVNYSLSEKSAKTGPQRIDLEKKIEAIVLDHYRPDGYTIQMMGAKESINWFRVAIIPILFLLYALLAISFESLTLPLLVLVTVPLTVFGAIWALFLTNLGIDTMAAIGVVMLLGLTVNPAILLVDRMQQKLKRSRSSGGKAALAAVRERVRPVLMTSCTTIAGMWPLAIAKGQELEVWPPFATVVMGGMVASTLLTLVIIPIGFVFLSKVDKVLAYLGPWKLMMWLATTSIAVIPITNSELITSSSWQVISTCLIGGVLFWFFVKVFYRQPIAPLGTENMVVETRFLSKVYGQPGPFTKALYRCFESIRQFNSQDIIGNKENFFMLLFLAVACIYLAINLQSLFWRIIFSYLAGIMTSRVLIFSKKQIISLSKYSQKHGLYSSFDHLIKILTPWVVLAILIINFTLLPSLNRQPQAMLPAVAVLLFVLTCFIQAGRSTATAIATDFSQTKSESKRFKVIKNYWRRICKTLFSWGYEAETFTALKSINFRAEVGMIGIIGPNGAGKTTLFRILASVLDCTVGTIHYAHVEKRSIRTNIARIIGFLPQEFGLPGHLTGRKYLDYFALLYEVGDKIERSSRVDELLEEVGLNEKQHEKISTYSGGMRQRLAVARTLLRQPSVIIVDEPTAGLDPRERIRFRNLLAKLSKDRVVLFSTHVVEDVAAACDRVVVIKTGAIVYDGKPSDLAQLAKNKIWQVILPRLQAVKFEKQFKVINQIPEKGDRVNLRVLANHKPHQKADVVEPTLEDGYFQLFTRTNTENA